MRNNHPTHGKDFQVVEYANLRFWKIQVIAKKRSLDLCTVKKTKARVGGSAMIEVLKDLRKSRHERQYHAAKRSF